MAPVTKATSTMSDRRRPRLITPFTVPFRAGLQYGCSKSVRAACWPFLVFCDLQEFYELPEKDSNLH
jgi:hypothetical protein